MKDVTVVAVEDVTVGGMLVHRAGERVTVPEPKLACLLATGQYRLADEDDDG